jgi:Ca2+/H+ antiporter
VTYTTTGYGDLVLPVKWRLVGGVLATLTASLVTNSGRSAWFVGVLVLMVYFIFALTLYLLPPGAR